MKDAFYLFCEVANSALPDQKMDVIGLYEWEYLASSNSIVMGGMRKVGGAKRNSLSQK